MSEFFLKRYRQINHDAQLTELPEIRQAIRINTTKATDEQVLTALKKQGANAEKIPYLQHGYYVTAEFSIGSTKEYLLGWYYIQAPLSQLVSEILNPEEGTRVLDMAAAPGSKTTHLATLTGENGEVVALDVDAQRLAAVRNNVERLGLANVVCVRKDARHAHDLHQEFPSVLLDAPCSGNFCSEEGWTEKRTIQDIRSNARLQKELFKAAYACCAPGGKILYSTCSLEPEEDELLVHWALQRYPDLTTLPLDIHVGSPGTTHWEEDLDPRVANTRRFWPHETGTEGFFIALLQKGVGRR